MNRIKLITLLVISVLALFSSKETIAQENFVQVALVNPVQLVDEKSEISGIRINLIYGKNKSITGLDWGMVNHTTSGTSLGLEGGLVGLCDANFTGIQLCGVNVTKKTITGLQWGLVNYGGTVDGVQFGLVNYASTMKSGIQIGLINIIAKGSRFPVLPIVNWVF